MRTVDPATQPRTPDERAEAIISSVLAGDVVDQQAMVRRRRAALALGRRYHSKDHEELQSLQWALEAAERYLTVVDQRQAVWRRERAFDRDLIERVLLMARVADFGGDRAVSGDVSGDRPPAVGAAAPPAGTTVAAVLGYLRRHHPPAD